MARLENDLLKLRGTLGGLTFYRGKNGETLVKEKAKVSKEKIKTSETSKGTRDGNSEWGIGSTAGKIIRHGFNFKNNDLGDTYISARLTGAIRKVVGRGKGAPGERILDLRKNSAPLEDLEFIKARPLLYSVGGIKKKPTTNTNRNEVYWTSPTLNRKEQITAPKEATHFKFILGAATVSNFKYDETLKKYACLERKLSGLGGYVYSEPIVLKQKLIDPILLTLELTKETIPENVAIVTAVGVSFFRNVNGELLEIKDAGGMRVLGVV